MDEIIKALAPHISTALIAIVTAASAWLVAWLQGRAAKERAIVQGAVCEVEALKAPLHVIPPNGAKQRAMEIAAARGVTLNPDKLAALVEQAHAAEKAKRASEPPSAR